jgi:hypothetical protein
VHDIVRGPNHALCLAVLWGSIQTRHTQLNTSGEKEGARGGVIELTTIVALDGLNGEAELSGHPGKKKCRRVGKVSDLARKGKVQK